MTKLHHPESHTLGLVQWDLFVTLTLPENLLEAGDARLGSTVFAWLRKCAEFGLVHFNALHWAVRSEKGESTARLHFHALLGNFPPNRKNQRTRFAIKNEWERLTGAMARVFKFNDGLSGVGYVLKGGAAYEMGKFRSATDSVLVSNNLSRSLALTTARRIERARS